jgi:hypothetical protein
MDTTTIAQQYRLLRLHARDLDDVMQTRIRASNRNGAFLRANNSDCGFDDEAASKFLDAAEKQYLKNLIAAMRELTGPHMQAFLATPGIGDKSASRLIGEIGHPVIAFPKHWEERPDAKGTDADPKRVLIEDEPFERMVSQLWTYCGYGDATKRHRKGMTQDEALACGSPRAKSLTYLLSVGCMKLVGGEDKNGVVRERSPYRNVYEEAKAHYETARPEWTPAHRHNAALRKVSKEILKDLWIAAKADLAEDRIEDKVLLAA